MSKEIKEMLHDENTFFNNMLNVTRDTAFETSCQAWHEVLSTDDHDGT
jgi:hypothetical protein